MDSQNILLANYWNVRSIDYPLSIGYIAGALRAARIDFLLRDYNFMTDQKAALLHDIEVEHVDIVLLGGHLGNYSYRHVKGTCREIKMMSPHTQVILGGPMVSAAPSLLLCNMEVDVVVIGEGEETIVDLLSRLLAGDPIEDCQGIAYMTNEEIIHTPPRGRIRDVDSISYPAYDMFDTPAYVKYMKHAGYGMWLLGSRGCFNNCSFCFRPFGQRVTCRSAESIVKEMMFLHEQYGIDRFSFVDENFLSSPKMLKTFCSLLVKTDASLTWRCQTRLELINEATVSMMIESGFQHGVSIGFESGSQRILDTIGKRATIEVYEKSIEVFHTFNVPLYPSFIIGFPQESRKTLQETKEFIERNALSNIWINYLVPYPGTSLYHYALERGIITDEDHYCESLGPLGKELYVNLTAFSDEELKELREEYFGNLNIRRATGGDPLISYSPITVME